VTILVAEPVNVVEAERATSSKSALELPASTKPGGTADQVARGLLLTILFAVPALICVHTACANDPDIFWHLRTGQWMLQHHAIPRVDPFSGPNAGKPWQAYSWLYELLTFQLFQRFGLAGIVGYSAGMVLAITMALWHLIKRLQSDFSVVGILMFVTCFSISHLLTPRPWLFTILFFVLEIDILMHVRKTGRVRELAWLPVIFALWSNIHIQFIDGLLVLGLAAVEAVVTHRGIGEKTRLHAMAAWTALGASMLATLVNPFGWHIYRVAYDLASQPGVMNKISELQAIPFRDTTDFSVLFLTLAATAALAWRKRFQVFEIGLLTFGAVLSFRSQRDVWVVGIAAATILASCIQGRAENPLPLPRFATKLAIFVAALAMLAAFPVMHVNNSKLAAQVASTLPVDAVHAIQAHGYAGPLYNDFTWGGYLIWALRMPVSLDGRAAFYGDQVIDRSVATWNAQPDWASDPELASAGVVLGPVKSPLIQVLRLDPKFRLVFEDRVAAVFVAQK
jgi:hypothetical protein